MEDRRDWEDRNAVEEEIFFFFFFIQCSLCWFNLKLEFKVSSPCAAAALITGAGHVLYLIVTESPESGICADIS